MVDNKHKEVFWTQSMIPILSFWISLGFFLTYTAIFRPDPGTLDTVLLFCTL